VSIRAEPDRKFAKRAWLRALERTASIERERDLCVPVLIDRLADRHGPQLALASPGESLTYRALAARAHRYARWGLAQGLRSGDTVVLLMGNRPEYLAVWFGLTRLGVTVALANTHLTGEALVHSVAIVAPKCIVVGAAHAAALAFVRERLPPAKIWVHGDSAEDFPDLAQLLADVPDETLSAAECALPSVDSTALYIYTSGTTGLPKAAKVSHHRLLQWSHWFAGLLDVTPSDRMYDCLPLYHSVGGVVATGATLVGGGVVEIRERFSVSDFWRDVRDSECTLFQYIGELCRYLVNAPPRPEEREHRLRIACGNGMRPEVWGPFQERFRVPRILEYYASTEGNFSLYNCEGEPGAIGRIPAFLAARVPVALVRVAAATGEPLRNAAGFCETCAPDEAGEALGRVAAEGQPGAAFEGYQDPEASARKLLGNVFAQGDLWYRTGDLLRRDTRGFYYFVDRIGDTFRWKGENVSTAEVVSALSTIPGVGEVVVYGVQIPASDGRAGMAALVVTAEFDLTAFRVAVAQRLPAYARPVFLRLLRALAATGTFKPKTLELMREGWDPGLIGDPLYFDDPREQAYVPLDAATHAALGAGKIRI
jgi:fatty-acyl-CoA synthase